MIIEAVIVTTRAWAPVNLFYYLRQLVFLQINAYAQLQCVITNQTVAGVILLLAALFPLFQIRRYYYCYLMMPAGILEGEAAANNQPRCPWQ